MTTRNAILTSLLIIAAGLVYSLALYSSLPALIPIHWGIDGRVDDWAPKQWAAYFGPVFGAVLLLVLLALPKLSPRQFEVQGFRRTYDYITVLLVGLFGFIHVVSLQAALNPHLDSGRWIVGGLMLLMALLGNVLGKVRRNFWVGIRTPWTLASEDVWVATHRLAARMLLTAGALGVLVAVLGMPPAISLGLLMVALFFPVVYSLVLYRRADSCGGAGR